MTSDTTSLSHRVHHKPVIGLCGGIGSGKSHVARLMAEMGCAVIDADALAREALDDSGVRERMVQLLGMEILDPVGRPDRRAVARKVFDRPDLLRQLEEIVHPYVHDRRALLRTTADEDDRVVAIVEDCPLLFEKALDSQCDRTIFIAASRATRLARVASQRGWSDQELASRERNQLELDSKAQRADYVIENESGGNDLRPHIRRLLTQIIQESKA
ncbi:MAG: dephospho-CoA kinase [Phycisphaeraceae bacterium]|nr:dephospho-CoA kinase [Phycisphaeraceae bacterium]